MALIRKQSAPIAATPTALYTVTNPTIISSITATNRSATEDYITINIRALGAAVANEHRLIPDIVLSGNDMYAFTGGITLLATDIVEVTSTNGTSTFQLFGKEI